MILKRNHQTYFQVTGSVVYCYGSRRLN